MSFLSEAFSPGNVNQQNFVRTSRLFYIDPTDNVFEGWYFKVRGPRYYGPFLSRLEASATLNRVISEYCASKDSSGR